ncbi:replicative helicase loader/inhibitor [Sutcliffiella horikoshii]|uniref:replicative helicase loader/inhibitor n=1 Tax=Sutcliffiella horikoshii TaxID=79883 RepID=UPI003CF57B26
MTREQVVQLFKYIKMAYENFDVSSDKVDFWHESIKNQSLQNVLNRFKKHVKTNKYPPTISDIYEEPSESKVNHEHLEYMRKLRSGLRDY